MKKRISVDSDVDEEDSGYTTCLNGHRVKWTIENGYQCEKCGDSAC